MIAPLTAGPAPAVARLTVILVHGRGGSPDDMLGIAREVGAADVSYIAPAAPGRTWYPYSFLRPAEENEPQLGAALAALDGVVNGLGTMGVLPGRIAFVGFSQGACLSLEYAARHARRYAAVVGLSGGLIGPPGTPREYEGAFDGTPVLLGCSDIDPHIPVGRVEETAAVFRGMGAKVDERIYPGMGHIVNRDEIEAMARLLGGPAAARDAGGVR